MNVPPVDNCHAVMQRHHGAALLAGFANATTPPVAVGAVRPVPERISKLIAALKRVFALRLDLGEAVAAALIPH